MEVVTKSQSNSGIVISLYWCALDRLDNGFGLWGDFNIADSAIYSLLSAILTRKLLE